MKNTTIVAISTGQGGAISLIRMSGPQAVAIIESAFSKPLTSVAGYTVHFGTVSDDGRVVDEVLVTLFRAPRSYTGEDMVEISCHGSAYVTREILALMVRRGATAATAGEFTQRAFLNGKLDLSQAEAVADLIASDSAAAHRIAMNQMRGGYAVELSLLREKLLRITSLLELELDFSEEDVEFADRLELKLLLNEIRERCQSLAESFQTGNVLKNGVPVAIVGAPNAGKSTLLNCLLGEERAIVSEIAGTTRDFIEEILNLDGVLFRFIDTAGIRHTDDIVEALGIERTKERITHSALVLLMICEPLTSDQINSQIEDLQLSDQQQLVILLNKSDLWDVSDLERALKFRYPVITLSARTGDGVEHLKALLTELIGVDNRPEGALVVSNVRHYEALLHSSESLDRAIVGLEQVLPTDLISEDVRQVLYYLGTITGEITTDEILGNIFSKFCIGK